MYTSVCLATMLGLAMPGASPSVPDSSVRSRIASIGAIEQATAPTAKLFTSNWEAAASKPPKKIGPQRGNLQDGASFLRTDHLIVTLHGKAILHAIGREAPSTGKDAGTFSVDSTVSFLQALRAAATADKSGKVGAQSSFTFDRNKSWINQVAEQSGLGGFFVLALPRIGTAPSSNMAMGYFGRLGGSAEAGPLGLTPLQLKVLMDQFVAKPLSDALDEQAEGLMRAKQAAQKKVNLQLVIRRDPTRKVDIQPLAYLGTQDKEALEVVRKAAQETIDAFKKRIAEIANFKEATKQLFVELKEKSKRAADKLDQDPDFKDLKESIIAFQGHIQETEKRIDSMEFLHYLMANSMTDFNQLDADAKSIKASFEGLTNSLQIKVQKELKDLIDYALTHIPGTGLIEFMRSLLSSLVPKVEVIERITRAIDLGEGDLDIRFENSGGAFGTQALQSEDDVEIILEHTGADGKLKTLASESYVAFRGLSYWSGSILPMGVMYDDGEGAVEAGVGQFAIYHQGGRGKGANMKRNFGIAIGVGTDGGDESGAAAMVGLSFLRDKVIIGYGRNFGRKENFYYLGIPVFKF